MPAGEAASSAVPVRLCLVVRSSDHPDGAGVIQGRAAGGLAADGFSLIGAVADAAGNVLRFVDVWFHDPSGVVQRLVAGDGALTNAALDERWQTWVRRSKGRSAIGLIEHGREGQRSGPWVLDLEKMSCGIAVSPGGAPWELCISDAELAAAGKPAYSSTTRRHLRGRAADGTAMIVPAPGGGEGMSDDAVAEEALGLSAQRIGLNLSGGYWAATPHLPLSLQHMAEWLGARPLEDIFGLVGGRSEGNAAPAGMTAGDLGTGLLAERAGDIGASFAERLHLKLRLLLDAVAGAQELMGLEESPLLSLRTASFGVDAAGFGEGLPWAWTSRALLLETGPAPAIPISGGKKRYFVPQPDWLRSEFSPTDATSRESEARLRIAAIVPADKGVSLDAVLETTSALVVGPGDYIQVTFVVGGRQLCLYGQRKAAQVKARNEMAILTLPEVLPEAVLNDLNAARAKILTGARVSVLQMLDTPSDLWSLGVVAMSVLLANAANSRAETVSQLRSLAMRLGDDAGSGTVMSLEERVAAAFAADKDLRELLGPHRALWSGVPSDVAGTVPAGLWNRIIAMLVRTMVGYPDCPMADLGDSKGTPARQVVQQLRQDLYTLVCESRGLIFSSAGPDVEVAGLIRKKLSELGA